MIKGHHRLEDDKGHSGSKTKKHLAAVYAAAGVRKKI